MKWHNRHSTKKQTAAQKRNFSIFRLRGMVASIETILYDGELKPKTNARLFIAKDAIRCGLIEETGK